jgi:Raf kinase inhibitor-like YbhB/YbcL family protein
LGQEERQEPAPLEVTSAAFTEGNMIPKKYTCDGENISPPLAWSTPPAGAKSIAVINDDPDAPAGTWTHWVIFNIPATVTSLPENIPPLKTLEDGSVQGANDFRKIGYGGPCPPFGVHRYYFKVYALDSFLDLKPGATKREVLRAANGHILSEGMLMGRYKR